MRSAVPSVRKDISTSKGSACVPFLTNHKGGDFRILRMMRKHLKKIIAFALAVVCCAGAFPNQLRRQTHAVSSIAELELQKAENNKKIQEYEQKLAKFSEDQKNEEAYQKTLTEKIDTLQNNMQILETELETIQQTIFNLDMDIFQMENTISQQEVEIEKGMKEFKLRLRAMYVNGNDSLASALVGATDFYDFLSRYKLISCVAKHDDELVTNLRDQLKNYHENLDTLQSQKDEQEQAKSDLEARQKEMQSSMGELRSAYADSQAEKERIANELTIASQGIQSLEEKNRLADETEKEIQEQIIRAQEKAKKEAQEKAQKEAEEKAKKEAQEKAQKEAEEKAKKEAQEKAQKEAEEKAKKEAQEKAVSTQPVTNPVQEIPAETVPQTVTDNSSYDDSAFGWPCPQHYYISSGYGERWGTLHKGVDIAQNQGAEVVASRSGTVIKTFNGCTHNYGKSENCCGNGYGNYVIIMHDDGTYSTLYGHMEKVVVSVNQYVEKGTTIGYVGTTGWSTGYHLHFEIRKDGTAVDPADYLNY